jgi:hypothetical protein
MEHLKGASLGQASALPANIRLSWKGFAGQTLWLIAKISKLRTKKFYNIGPWCQGYKIFFVIAAATK